MRTSTRMALPFFYALLVGACSNNDSYPKEYIGFERAMTDHTFDANNQEETITIKIVAGEKQDEDQKLKLNSSQPQVLKITEPNPIIAKGKKSVKVDVILNQGQRFPSLTCKPERKDTKVSEMSIHLRKK